MAKNVEDIDYVEANFKLISQPEPHVDVVLTIHDKDGTSEERTGVVLGAAAGEIAMTVLTVSGDLGVQKSAASWRAER